MKSLNHRRQKGLSHFCQLKNFKKIVAVNNPVIIGVQTLVCAYAKLKLGFHHKKIYSKN